VKIVKKNLSISRNIKIRENVLKKYTEAQAAVGKLRKVPLLYR